MTNVQAMNQTNGMVTFFLLRTSNSDNRQATVVDSRRVMQSSNVSFNVDDISNVIITTSQKNFDADATVNLSDFSQPTSVDPRNKSTRSVTATYSQDGSWNIMMNAH
ncbi:hypothetical protein ACTHGU_05285 [Chitinophagaceae bacterium MMS25-I14]